MEIKAGDKVRIKSWEAMEAEYAGTGIVPSYIKHLCGEVVTVQEINEEETAYFEFFVKESPHLFMADWMVEEVIREV